MKKILTSILLCVFAVSAASASYYKPPKVPKPSVSVRGHNTTGAWLGIGIVGCQAAGLLAGAAYKGATEHKELSLREAHGIFWGCAIPVVGYFLSEAMWNANPQWKQYEH